MVVEVAARALTKHALNVHCGHDDIYSALDTGWIMLFGKDAQQAADQALIIRKVTELSLTPGINIQDGFLTSHLERTFLKHESDLIREFLGSPDDMIDCPTEAQRILFGPKRLRVPKVIDLQHPAMIGPVQNQEHYMNGVAARRNNFIEPILGFLEHAYEEFGKLTGRHYGLISQYKTDDAETVYVSMGSAAENIEAACDYLRETRGAKVGSIHLNVIRPFPEAAIVKALAGKKQVIILERTDEPLAGDNPMARDIRTALSKALQNFDGLAYAGIPAISPKEMPHIATGIYGLGSRDFRPEDIIGAYEYTQGLVNRQDGKRLADGASFFTLGIDHPYNVRSAETPSLLPENAIAVRLHSIGGWGMITTGKNLAEIIGEIGTHVADRDGVKDELGQPGEVIHISANPKYGSEKKGSPTSYFLVAAPERVRVNCDLRHVNVVLCCDPRAFTHINPIDGIAEGGTLVWESDETPEKAWTRIPKKYRQEIIDKRIRVYILPGFTIAKEATDRHDLQLRMQGNAFLGAFFKVSSLLSQFKISEELFHELVLAQYKKKFGRFGDAVVQSNMQVMIQGGERLQQVHYGEVAAMDASSMRGLALEPAGGCGVRGGCGTPAAQPQRVPMYKLKTFDDEFRAGLGYDQPASPLSAVGIMAAGTGATASKYGARRETPRWIPENCTQCMECIAACPDTALPNTAQDLSTILTTAITNYVTDKASREKLLAAVPALDSAVRAKMLEHSKSKTPPSYVELVMDEIDLQEYAFGTARTELETVLRKVPVAYSKVNAVFASREKKETGAGGVFSIFVSDLCKGCGECVTECGDHEALVMVPDNEEVNSGITSAQNFFDLLPETPSKYLGLYDAETPQESRQAALRNHFMVRKNYEALVSGDGACAGCGEKSVLHALASITEAYMRPLYHNKARRLREKADRLEKDGVKLLAAWKKDAPEAHDVFTRSVAHVLMGLGGETDEDTRARLDAHGEISDADAVNALIAVLRQTAFNHDSLQALDGRLSNGMAVMAMGAHTGCNTVYGSTPPNNPHPYPWMNSLFQDGATISWLMGESFMIENARFSIVPERLADRLLGGEGPTEQDYFNYTHFTDAIMTDQEVAELPKVWTVGGDGGMGDIGYQNVSKVIVQNRPNVKCLMLDTQVYSNTGGQNSDASPMTGGFDMNQFGKASQGKLVEMKNIAESFTAGHGSPYVAQVSMADEPKFYKSLLDGLTYRGTAFFLCYTTCQPEHGVGDDMATQQAKSVRDSRGLPEFTFNPALGETYAEALSVKGNRNPDRDWMEATYADTKEKYNYTVAHWAATEARFRQHIKKASEEEIQGMVLLDNLLLCIEQNDVVNRRYFDPASRSFIPDFGAYVVVESASGKRVPMKLSRQMVLFNVERRKAWRMLQSKSGQENKDYPVHREIIKRLDAGKLTRDQVWSKGAAVLNEEETVPAK
jgi:pyruvate-ferredoxin/flavodoxin oxidoreductase